MIPSSPKEVINTKTPVSRVGNKTAILHILYALFPLQYGRFIDVFGGSGSVLLGKPTVDAFEVYNDFDRNLVNLFRCMKTRTMATIHELGFCTLNSRDDFNAIRRFFEDEKFIDPYLTQELELTEILLPPLEAEELKELRLRLTSNYDVRRAAMFLKLLRYSYYIMKGTTPLAATAWSAFAMVFSLFLMGEIMMVCNLWTKKGIGPGIVSAFLLLDFFLGYLVGAIPRELVWVSPLNWIDRSMLVHPDQNLPSFGYAVGVLLGGGALLGTIILLNIHKCNLDATKE